MVILLAALLTSDVRCPVKGATYQYDSDKSITARIDSIPILRKNLYMTISDGTGRRLYFTFDRGSADSSARLVSSKTDPGLAAWKPQDPDTNRDRAIHDQRYFLFFGNGNLAEPSIPDAVSAPEIILVPDLAEELFYRRDPALFKMIPRGLFRIRSCGNAI